MARNHLPITHREMRDLAERALDDGWTIEKTAGDRLKWAVPGGGHSFFTGITCKDHRAVKNIERDMRHALKRAEDQQKKMPPAPPMATTHKDPPLRAPLGNFHKKTIERFQNVFVEKKVNEFVEDLVQEHEEELKKKQEKKIVTVATAPVRVEPKSIPKPILNSTPVVVLPKVCAPLPENKSILNVIPAAVSSPPSLAPHEKQIISIEEAFRLIIDDIENHKTYPPRASDAVFELYRVRTRKSVNGEPSYYKSGNSLHGALCERHPRYKVRGGGRPYIPPHNPPATEPVPPPLPQPPYTIIRPGVAIEPKSDFEAQVRSVMEMPGISDEKRQAMLRLLLEK